MTDEYIYIGKDGRSVLARDLEDERDALREENKRLREVVGIVTDCLEECVIADYPEYKLAYPHNQQRYENDMEPVREARAVLTDKGERYRLTTKRPASDEPGGLVVFGEM